MVTVYVGSSVLGQGLETTLAQVAADTLQTAVRPHPHPARLDHLSARGLRHLRSRSDGGRRLGGDGRLRQSRRRHPRRGAPSASAFPMTRSSIADGVVSAGAKRGDLRGICRRSKRKAPSRPRSAPTATARMPAMSRSMPRTGHVESSRLCRDRGCRPRDQSAYRARPGDRRAGAGTGRRLPRPDHLRR